MTTNERIEDMIIDVAEGDFSTAPESVRPALETLGKLMDFAFNTERLDDFGTLAAASDAVVRQAVLREEEGEP